MTSTLLSAKTRLIAFGNEAFNAGLLSSTCGNASLRLDAETLLISGTGTRVQDLSAAQLSTVRIADGVVLAGPAASMETSMHRQVYALRPEVGAVLHCQSPAATLLACHVAPPDNLDLIPEVPAYVRRHAYVPWAMAGSEALATLVAEALGDRDVTVVQMRNHGQLICGATAASVLRRGVFFEFACALWAQGAGALCTIPAADAAALRAGHEGLHLSVFLLHPGAPWQAKPSAAAVVSAVAPPKSSTLFPNNHRPAVLINPFSVNPKKKNPTMPTPPKTTMPTITEAAQALIIKANYNPDDARERELGLMALHCAGMFFETGTVTGTPPNRNSPCPCGSGKKYKKCCRADDEARATTPPRKMALGHIPQLFNNDAMDADQDKLYSLLLNAPTLRSVRYDATTLDTFLRAGLPDNKAELDAEGWTDIVTDLAQQFYVKHAADLDVIGALLRCGRTGDVDELSIRALANGVLHLSMAEMSGQQEMNLVAAEILRVTVHDAEAAGTPILAFGHMELE